MNLTARLVDVWRGTKPNSELDRYDLQRRLVTKEHVEKQSIQNKKNLESQGPEFRNKLTEIAADRERTYQYLLSVSMIGSLRRAEELG
jgi:3-(3-hydroxy-phenyl)propionate hydroxylase